MISSRCEELINYWRSARKSFSPEDIHDLRVASRRLREAITIFAPCYPSKKLSHIRAQARNLTNLLGIMRNTDEALLFFTSLLPSLPKTAAPSLETWLQSLSNRRSKEQRNLADRLKMLDLTLMQYGLAKALERPYLFEAASYDPFMTISDFFDIKLTEREISLQQLLPDSLNEQNTAALHKLRIALKKFRYAFELTAPLNRDGYKELHAVLKEFQEVLGKIHDLDVFMELIQEQEFDPECSVILTDLVASTRKLLHAHYLTLHTAHPVDKLGERARELL
jgi:CHAD domain-containing protein